MALDEFLPLSGLGLHIRPHGLVCLFGEAFGEAFGEVYLVRTLAPCMPRVVEVVGGLQQSEDKWEMPGQGQHVDDTDVSLCIPANPQILSSLWVPEAGPSGEQAPSETGLLRSRET